MVKCLECGAEEKRLQWTHFKFKCTGRFQNGTEYMAAYPGAKVVDPAVAASTAVTLNNLIKKYGHVEGQRRWDQYKQKQAYSNSFEYKNLYHGWTRDQFDEFNSSRAQTLDKMMQRHGEKIGAELWEKYCLQQAYTNTKEYFVKKYGEVDGIARYLEINNKKAMPHKPDVLAVTLGITVEKATELILARQTQFFTSNIEQEFTNLLEAQLGPLDHTSQRNPYGKWSELLGTYVIYDIKHRNCIIEFNGDYWHANPRLYHSKAIIRGKEAASIWNRDMLKLQTVESLGFKTYTVWESEFKLDKVGTIKKVIKWILQEQQ